RGKPRPVTRLNRRTIAVLAAVATAAILIAILWGLRTPDVKPEKREEEKRAPERITLAPGLANLPGDYSSIPRAALRTDPAPELGPPLGEFGQPLNQSRRAAPTHPQRSAVRGGASSGPSLGPDSDKAIFFDLPDRSRRTGTGLNQTIQVNN